MKTSSEILIHNIRRLREERGLSQAQMAEHVNVALRTWQDYEYQKNYIKPPMVDKIAEFFGVSVASLYSEEGESRSKDSVGDLLLHDSLKKILSVPEDILQLVINTDYSDQYTLDIIRNNFRIVKKKASENDSSKKKKA